MAAPGVTAPESGFAGTGTTILLTAAGGGILASRAVGDLLIAQVEVRDVTNTPATPSGWTLVRGPDATTLHRQWIYARKATSTGTGSPADNLSSACGGSSLKMAQMVCVTPSSETRVFEGTVGFNFEGAAVQSGTVATITAASVTTTGVDRRVLQFVSVSDDNALDPFTGAVGGDAAYAETAVERTSTAGSDGAIGIQTCTRATAGSVTGGTDVMSAADSWIAFGVAIMDFPKPVYELHKYRFRYDDGNEATATWMAAAETPVTLPLTTPFRLRLGLKETNAGNPLSTNWQIEYAVNGGAWATPGSGTPVIIRASPNVADGEATTQQLTTGTFTAGKFTDVATGIGIDYGPSFISELEWSLQVDAATNGDILTFRLFDNTAGLTIALTVTATVTVGSTGSTVAIGGVAAATTVRGVTLTGSGSVGVSLGRVAAASTVRGVTVVPSGVATVIIGRRTVATTVFGVTPTGTGTITLAIGRAPPVTTVRGVAVTGSGTVGLTIGTRAAATTVRGVTPTGVGTTSFTVGRRAAATSVFGVTITATGSVTVPIGQRAAATSVFGVTLSGDASAIVVGKRTASTSVFGVTAAATGSAPIALGKRVAATTVFGVTPTGTGTTSFAVGSRAVSTSVFGVTPTGTGVAALSVGRLASASVVYGVTPTGSGSVSVTVGRKVAATSVFGVTVTGEATAVSIGTVGSTSVIRGVTATATGVATLSIGSTFSTTTVRGVTPTASGSAAVTIGRVQGATTGYGIAIVATGAAPFTVGKVASGTALHGVTFAPSAVTVPIGQISGATTIRGVTLSGATQTYDDAATVVAVGQIFGKERYLGFNDPIPEVPRLILDAKGRPHIRISGSTYLKL